MEISPDRSAAGLSADVIDPFRYDGHFDHPLEVAGMLKSMMPKGVRVLDVGCGTGSVTVIANSGKGNEVVAVEPDSKRAETARSRGLDVHVGYLTDDLLQTVGLFDVVMSSDVLEHTPNPSDVLATMARALKPHGIILVSVPNIAHWSVRLSLLRGQFDYEPVGIMDATHLRWFTIKTLRTLFEQNRLDIIEAKHTAGVTLPVYERGPIGRIGRGKRLMIRTLTKAFPLLFGVQHVVKARLRA